MAIYFKNCCYCLPLRIGIIILAIFLTCQGIITLIFASDEKSQLCLRELTLWFFAAGFNILTAFLIFIATFRDRHRILPVAVVTKLIGLIIEMFYHLYVASAGVISTNLIIYSLCSIAVTTYAVFMIFSYFQQEELDL